MRKELKILLFASALFTISGGLLGPIYAVFVEQIGGDLLTAGGSYSAFAISMGAIIFFISRWEDHVKHQEKMVIIGLTLSSLGFFGYLLVQSPIHLFIIQAILGIGGAVWIPASDSIYSKNLDKGKFASEWGLWDSIYWISMGLSASIGGFLANIYGFRFLFAVMFFVSLAGLITSVFLIYKKK